MFKSEISKFTAKRRQKCLNPKEISKEEVVSMSEIYQSVPAKEKHQDWHKVTHPPLTKWKDLGHLQLRVRWDA